MMKWDVLDSLYWPLHHVLLSQQGTTHQKITEINQVDMQVLVSSVDGFVGDVSVWLRGPAYPYHASGVSNIIYFSSSGATVLIFCHILQLFLFSSPLPSTPSFLLSFSCSSSVLQRQICSDFVLLVNFFSCPSLFLPPTHPPFLVSFSCYSSALMLSLICILSCFCNFYSLPPFSLPTCQMLFLPSCSSFMSSCLLYSLSYFFNLFMLLNLHLLSFPSFPSPIILFT